jgi:hypothetical protein
MHQGALAASGDILVFLHADSLLPENWKECIIGAWKSRRKPAATAFRLGFDRDGLLYSLIALLGHWRSLLTGVPLGDQALAVRREDYLSVGGFPDVSLMEEYYLLSKLKTLGPVRILPQRVKTSCRRYEQNGALFNSLRNLLLTCLFYLGVPPRLIAKAYR